MPEQEDMFAANCRHWDERVAVHLGPGGYDLSDLRAGRGRLDALEDRELAADVGDLAGLRVIHLQCHFGKDSLALTQRGAEVTGVDFSPAAIEAARALARELGLEARARFFQCDLYEAPKTIGEEAKFDLAYVTWGALGWLPDMTRWARVVAHFLKPGGRLYLLDGHPAALVFDDRVKGADGRPGWLVPYLARQVFCDDDPSDYVDETAVLRNARAYVWLHPLGDVVTALAGAGLRIRFLREHDAVAWRMFDCLEAGADGMYRWPDRPWLPLAFSILAEREPPPAA